MTSQETTRRPAIPDPIVLSTARSSLHHHIPFTGIGDSSIQDHLNQDIVPALNASSLSPHYYGFVTGGTTPAATLADNIVTKYDQNVQVHLPNETVATNVEAAALSMLCELLNFEPDEWPHKTFTTGATASSVLGLACGREFVVSEAARRKGKTASVAEDGLFEAMKTAGIEKVQVLTTMPHSSLGKAASIVGLGRNAIVDVSSKTSPYRFDLDTLEEVLSDPGVASIVAVSASEVNSGKFATTGDDMIKIRELCTQHGAWIHVDAAFGLQARLLPSTQAYSSLLEGVRCLELADSITGDGHKMLNVPYDCGIFLSRHLALGTQVFQNANAAYLSSSTADPSTEPDVPSPLNIGIENSRRFRALPVYATLAAYGLQGHRDILERQIALSRRIARYLALTPGWELLPLADKADVEQKDEDLEGRLRETYVIVLFRAKDESLNSQLVSRIKASRRIYVSGTQWNGRPAARFAVANWQVEVERDFEVVRSVLEEVMQSS